MSFTVEFQEDYKSREISISETSFEQRVVFLIYGDFLANAVDQPPYGKNDDVIALQAAYTILPQFFIMPTYSGDYVPLVLSQLNLRMVDHDKWDVEVTYKQPEYGEGSGGSNVNPADYGPQAEDGATSAPNNYLQLGFNVSSENTKILQSKALLAKNVRTGVSGVPDYELYLAAPIGQTKEEVLGHDIYARSFSFNVTAYKTATELSFRYVRRLFRVATSINDRPFFGFPPGSVLFLEAQAQGDIFSVIPITFEFQVRSNFKLSLTEPSTLMDPDVDDIEDMYDVISDPFFAEPTYTNGYWKDSAGVMLELPDIFSGWDVVDYRYSEGETDGLGYIVQKPIQRLIHRVYGYANFIHLQIGHI